MMTKNLPNSQLCNQLPWTVRWYGDACAARYGEAYPVIKEECTGHVQKRMGGGLHKLKRKRRGQKLSDGKGVGGTGRLTEGMIDRIQNIQNSDIDSMKKAINAILHHMIKDDTMSLVQQHMYCPRHSKTWCKFWLDKLHDKGTYNESSRLPTVFKAELHPLFDRLSIQRYSKGLTKPE